MSASEKVAFAPAFEPWCGYQCADGTWLRARLVVRNVRRKVGEFNERGEPAYEIDYGVLFETDSPPALHRDFVAPPVEGEVKH